MRFGDAARLRRKTVYRQRMYRRKIGAHAHAKPVFIDRCATETRHPSTPTCSFNLGSAYGFVSPRGILSIYSDCLSCQQICTLLVDFRCCGAQNFAQKLVAGSPHPGYPKSVTRSFTCNKIAGYAESGLDSVNLMNGNETNPTRPNYALARSADLAHSSRDVVGDVVDACLSGRELELFS